MTGRVIKELFITINSTGEGFIYEAMGGSMKETGSMGRGRDKELTLLQMGRSMLESTLTIRCTGLEYSYGPMAGSMKETEQMGNKMDSGNIATLRGELKKLCV